MNVKHTHFEPAGRLPWRKSGSSGAEAVRIDRAAPPTATDAAARATPDNADIWLDLLDVFDIRLTEHQAAHTVISCLSRGSWMQEPV